MTPTGKSCDTSLKQKLANLIASTPKTPTSKKRSRNTNNSFTSCKQIKFDNNLSSIAEDVLEEENHLNISSDDSFTSGQTCFNQMTIDDAEADNVEIANISTIDLELVKNPSGWLNDPIINKCQQMLKEQFALDSGMQNTLLAPYFNHDLGTWDINKRLTKQNPPSAQIHYNASNHWVLPYQSQKDRHVIVVDSLKSPRTLNSSISIQIAQIYENGERSVQVQIPDVQRQPNYTDCGVFAIANLTEVLHNNYDVDFSIIRYDIPRMRAHLLECITKQQFTTFPKIEKMPKMPCKVAKSCSIKIFCACKLPDIVGDMVECDNKRCKLNRCFHKRCVGYTMTNQDESKH